MKLRILTSCTGEKLHTEHGVLTQDDFRHLHEPGFQLLEDNLSEYRTPAQDIYTGQQHVRLMSGIRRMREAMGEDSVALSILSAGYGIIAGDRSVVPYECTFQGMKTEEIKKWAAHLNVPQDARSFFAEPADLTIVLLGDSYLRALALDDAVEFAAPTLFFTSTRAQKHVRGNGMFRKVPQENRDAKRFSCGLVGLKGELGKRLLNLLADKDIPFIRVLLRDDTDVLALLDTPSPVTRAPKGPARVNPDVDHVIQIPEAWWDKPHRAKLRYFIPEWDDLVDRDYDFEKDEHSGGTGDWTNEVYAHQLYPEPNYDGILISKVVAEKSKKKKERINALGVHRYLRVPPEFPIMGDCGAFGYIGQEVPPYTTNEILDYYTRLGFNYGVSLDHLIVTATEAQKQFRYDLTIHNAEEFLREHKKQGLPWEPIGAVQGWDAESYAHAARQYVAMGYRYIGIGGLVRTTTREILRILDKVNEVVPETINVHLFGIARIKAISDFARLGVRSVDSASYLRQAWMRGVQGYILPHDTYATLRIPEFGKSFRAKQMLQHTGLDADTLFKMEREAIGSIRALARHACSIDSCLNALLEYDRRISAERVDMSGLYRRTLEERPWEMCDCNLCKDAGVEIVIFRGNNRNRRRGFHNTFVFYRLMQRILAGESLKLFTDDGEGQVAPQLPLFVMEQV